MRSGFKILKNLLRDLFPKKTLYNDQYVKFQNRQLSGRDYHVNWVSERRNIEMCRVERRDWDTLDLIMTTFIFGELFL